MGALQELFGSHTSAAKLKKGYHLMRPMMTNADVSRIINSDEVQSAVQPAMKEGTKERKALLEKKRATAADAKKHSKGAKEFYKNMMAAYEVKAADAEDEE